MKEKLEDIVIRHQEVGSRLSDPDVVSDVKRYTELSKEFKELEELVARYAELKKIQSNLAHNKKIIETESDEEFRQMASEESADLRLRLEQLESELRELLTPKDPNDKKDAFLEIRAGTGGDEASIFAGDLFKMYTRFCEDHGFSLTVVSESLGTVGGFKEVVAEVRGTGVYGTLKYESGVHRVQRVPKTESQGRVHTSAATVAVLPEAEDVDIDIRDEDIRRDTFRASGAGGQHVNKTESAIRLTHIPTGIVVECQEGRSQLKNYEIAMRVLRTRIFEKFQSEQQAEIAAQRRSLVSSGDRSAKIRTYNFPQGRVTDHRINLTMYNLDAVMQGDLRQLIESLQVAERQNAEDVKE